jgi:hypothetical protein
MARRMQASLRRLRTDAGQRAVVLLVALALTGLSACSATDTGNSGNAGLATNTGNSGDTGNTGNGGNTGNTGNEGNTGNTGNTGSGGFCATHTCIANFANGTGYIVQCADGEWSHSGGRPGACSDHGGETGNTPAKTGNTGNTGSAGNTGGGTPGPANFAPGDHNPNDGHASDCDTTMEIGPHSDCSVAEQVANDVAAKNVAISSDFTFTDTVTDNANYPQEQRGDTITFNCQASDGPGSAYACVSTGDPQDWFDFSGQQ